MIKRELYQDSYNPLKQWEVNYMKGAIYLRQFINGVQTCKGLRCTKKYILMLGIYNMKQINRPTQ